MSVLLQALKAILQGGPFQWGWIKLGIERATLYRYVGPKGELRDYGKRVLGMSVGTAYAGASE